MSESNLATGRSLSPEIWRLAASSWLILCVVSLLFEKHLAKDLLHLSVFGYCLLLCRDRKPIPGNLRTFALLGLLFALTALVSELLSPLSQSFSRLEPAAKYLLIIPFVLLIQLARTNVLKIKQILLTALGFAFCIACYDFISHNDRDLSFHGQINKFGNLSILTGMLVFLLQDKTSRLGMVVAAGALSAGIFICSVAGARIGLLSFLVAFPVMLLFLRTEISVRRMTISVGFMILALSALFLQPDVVMKERMTKGVDVVFAYFAGDELAKRESAGIRLEIWQSAVRAWLDRPVVGVGSDGFQAWMLEEKDQGLIHELAATYNNAHNEYLGQLATNGILGLTILLALMVWLGRQYTPHLGSDNADRRRVAQAGIIMLIMYGGFSLTETFFSSHLGAGYFILVNCFLLGSIEEKT